MSLLYKSYIVIIYVFSLSTANIVTLEEKFKKWGSFFALSTDDMGFNSFSHH